MIVDGNGCLLLTLTIVLLFLAAISYMLHSFQKYQTHAERCAYYHQVWTNYFWWNRELTYAITINFSPNANDILNEVYSCIDKLHLSPDSTICFKQMIRCQVAVMQHPSRLELVQQWKIVASQLAKLLFGSPHAQILMLAQVDIMLQQIQHLKRANAYHVQVFQEQLLTSHVPILAMLMARQE